MASRKQLKKNIKHICDSLFADCLVLQLVEQPDSAALEALMLEVIQLRQEYVARISHTQPGNVREYYRKLRGNFLERANGIAQAIVKA